MNKKIKSGLKKIKKHAPVILSTVGFVCALVYAYSEHSKRVEFEDDSHGWSTIPISPEMKEDLELGMTLHYRQVRTSDDVYRQYATSRKSIGFTPEMDESFEKELQEKAD